MSSAEPALEVTDIAKRFGGIQAVDGVNLRVETGGVLGVIGPNGSGKTTLINLLTGAYPPDRGAVRIYGGDCAGRPAHVIAARGVARTFQNPRVFASLTVRQNMYVPVAHRATKALTEQLHGYVERWLDTVGLLSLADRVANELSGGQQKLVEFARAMVHKPRVVLMDEPFAGVHPEIKASLHDHIRRSATEGHTAFLIVSHEVPELMDLSNNLLCMAGGRTLAVGAPADVCANPAVVEAYLGGPIGDAA